MKRKTWGQQVVYISSICKSLLNPPRSLKGILLIFENIVWKHFEFLEHTIKTQGIQIYLT